MAVKNWPAESHMVGAVPVNTDGHMPAGHDHFEFAFAGMAEEGEICEWP